MRWHEKHAIVKAWGSQELKSMLSMAGSSARVAEYISDNELPSDSSAEEEDDFW
jgi:hypothetical protein